MGGALLLRPLRGRVRLHRDRPGHVRRPGVRRRRDDVLPDRPVRRRLPPLLADRLRHLPDPPRSPGEHPGDGDGGDRPDGGGGDPQAGAARVPAGRLRRRPARRRRADRTAPARSWGTIRRSPTWSGRTRCASWSWPSASAAAGTRWNPCWTCACGVARSSSGPPSSKSSPGASPSTTSPRRTSSSRKGSASRPCSCCFPGASSACFRKRRSPSSSLPDPCSSAALLIKIDSPGPVFYTPEAGGKEREDLPDPQVPVDAAGCRRGRRPPVGRTENDPRITRVGKILRKSRSTRFRS